MEIFNLPGVICVLDYGAVADGNFDCTDAFSRALADAGATGGTVYAPPGRYRFDGCLNVPVAVTLRGSYESVSANNGNRDAGLPKPGVSGTVFEVYGNRGDENAPAFITLNTNSVLKGVLVWYPEQTEVGRPYSYPWTVAMRGKNPAVLDTELLNPYNAIDATGNERHFIRGVYGQPLRRGIFIDGIYDIGRVEDVHFNPWWSMKPDIMRFMVEEGEAFIIGRTDWEYMYGCFSIFYHVGFLFDNFGHGAGNAVLTNCGHDIAPYAAIIKDTQTHAGVSFVNCQFMGDFKVCESNTGPVRLNGCGFWGVGANQSFNPGTCNNLDLHGTGHVIVNGCHLTGWDQRPETAGTAPSVNIDCRSAAVSTCDFIDAKHVHIRVGKNCSGASIVSCKFSGGSKIDISTEAKNVMTGFNLDI